MSKEKAPHDTIEQANEAIAAWQQLEHTTVVGIPLSDFEQQVRLLEIYERQVSEAKVALVKARQQRNDQRWKVWSWLKRIRKGIMGLFGDDSNEFALFGGVRTSIRTSKWVSKMISKRKKAETEDATQAADDSEPDAESKDE